MAPNFVALVCHANFNKFPGLSLVVPITAANYPHHPANWITTSIIPQSTNIITFTYSSVIHFDQLSSTSNTSSRAGLPNYTLLEHDYLPAYCSLIQFDLDLLDSTCMISFSSTFKKYTNIFITSAWFHFHIGFLYKSTYETVLAWPLPASLLRKFAKSIIVRTWLYSFICCPYSWTGQTAFTITLLPRL